jgi:hypothetical protein
VRNALVTITGQTGSGKSQITTRLIAMTPRVIILDRMFEYESAPIITDYDKSLQYLALNWRAPNFAVSLRYTQDEHYKNFFRYLAELSDRCPSLPVSVVVEEADFFMSPHMIDPGLSYLYRYGRHFRINIITIARGDTDIHRDAVQNAHAFVVMRSRKFSREMREKFDVEELERIRELQTLTPGVTPEKGVHYMVFPDDADLFELWRTAQA